MFCYDVQIISTQELYSFILQFLHDNVPAMKYMFAFISNQLIRASDCSYLVLVFWHKLSIHFLITFVLTKQSMIFKMCYDHIHGSKIFTVLYFVIIIQKIFKYTFFISN